MKSPDELLSQNDVDGAELVTSICTVSKEYISVIRSSSARNDTEMMNMAIDQLDRFMDKLINLIKTK